MTRLAPTGDVASPTSPRRHRRPRRALRIVARGLAAIGLVDVLVQLALIPLTGTIFGVAVTTPAGLEVDRIVASQDGRFKAVVFSE